MKNKNKPKNNPLKRDENKGKTVSELKDSKKNPLEESHTIKEEYSLLHQEKNSKESSSDTFNSIGEEVVSQETSENQSSNTKCESKQRVDVDLLLNSERNNVSIEEVDMKDSLKEQRKQTRIKKQQEKQQLKQSKAKERQMKKIERQQEKETKIVQKIKQKESKKTLKDETKLISKILKKKETNVSDVKEVQYVKLCLGERIWLIVSPVLVSGLVSYYGYIGFLTYDATTHANSTNPTTELIDEESTVETELNKKEIDELIDQLVESKVYQGFVNIDHLNVRDEPNENGNVIGSLELNDELKILEPGIKNPDWLTIEFEDGVGYVSEYYVVISELENN